MTDGSKGMSRRARMALGGAVLVVLGAAGGAGAVSLTRPGVEMAPASPVAVASLAQRHGVVTVRGKVAEVYGDRFVVADDSGRTMVDAGRGAGTVRAGTSITVQGRYDDGQLRASFLVDPDGTVEAVGRHHGFRGPGGPGGPGHDGPPPPPGGPGAPPPPPGCAPAAGAAPSLPAAGKATVPPPAAHQ